MPKKKQQEAKTEERFHVFAKIQHDDGDIEPRRLWLENFTRKGDAEMAANQATKYNPGIVLAAWVEIAA
jgi:hypothetical protein